MVPAEVEEPYRLYYRYPWLRVLFTVTGYLCWFRGFLVVTGLASSGLGRLRHRGVSGEAKVSTSPVRVVLEGLVGMALAHEYRGTNEDQSTPPGLPHCERDLVHSLLP